MSAVDGLASSDLTIAILDAMPIGVAIFDADRRLILMNAAYYASLDLPVGSFPPGTSLEEAMRQAAYRGVFGPGDPEVQWRQQMQLDRTRAGRLRRRRFHGRSYDLINTPLPDGGHLVNAVETTALIAAREEAEGAASQAISAVAVLRIGLAAFAANGTLAVFNTRFAELMGLPTNTLASGLSFAGLLDAMRGADEYTGFEGDQFLAEQARLDRRQPHNVRWLRPTGQVLNVASDPLADGGWSITVTDITPLARDEDESRRRVMMLDVLLERIPHGICVYGPDKRVRMFNRAYAEVMQGADVAIGDHLDDVIARRRAQGEFGPPSADQIYSRAEDRDFSRFHVRPRRRRPNGTYIDVRSAPLPDGGHVSVVTDVTQLAQAEAAVARHAEEMEAMFAHTRHGLTLWSVDKRLITANAKTAELLEVPADLLAPGLTQLELLRHMREHGAFGDEGQAEEYVRRTSAFDPTVPWSSERVTASGRILDVRSTPTTPGGFTVVTYTDITETRRAERELQEAVAAAEEANAAKARFLATMSHELRTPLNSVIGFSDTLMRDRGTTEPAQVREYAEDINTAGKRLLLLINNMLDVARIEAGRFDLGTDRIDIKRMVQSCLRQNRAAATAAEIEIFEEVPVPPPLVRGDERRMQQVLNNLLSNAIKFTEPGGAVTVTAEIDPAGDLLLCVSDTGIGIPADQISNAFEPFTQIESGLDRRFEGSGLGLYFSRALVQAHGGVLSLRSVVGKGTTAEIRLPARRLDSSD